MVSEIVRDTSPASLARANEANLAEGLALCARGYGGEVIEEPDLLWCATKGLFPGFNRAPRASLDLETADERIEWVKARAQALDVSFQWTIGPSTRPLDLGERLLRHGFTDAGEEPAMGVALATLPETLAPPEGVTVERVMDLAGLETWITVMCAGFGAPSGQVPAILGPMSRDTFDDSPAARYYLARLYGEPVACAGLTLGGGVAGIFSVATIESARRRGIGRAVTLAPLLAGRELGYAVGVLQASEMGYPVYAALGFTEQFRFHDYVWRPQ